MTTTPKDMLLLKDEAGDYYVLPQELLERGRVPAEQSVEAERVFAAAEADDVAGHLNFSKIEFVYRAIKFEDILVSSFATRGTELGALSHGPVYDADSAVTK